AVEEAYHGLLPERRYPLAVLDLELPYAEVDVNAHPAKREVRFRDERRVYSTLQKAVRAALIAHSPVPEVQRPSPTTHYQQGAAAASPGFFRSAFDSRGSLNAASQTSQRGDDSLPAHLAFTPQQALPSLNVVGQVKLTYIVAEGPDGMYLVDQHAAHERVVFDRLRRRAAQQSPESQPLLAPTTLELTPAQAETFQENADFLKAYGFEVEDFGANSYLLRAVPSVLSHQDPARSLPDILDLVSFEGLLRQHEDVLAATIACHSAIRAGKSLTVAEMQGLLEQLEATDNPHTCPHGRPTLIHFSEYQMEREFGRR
ncbi:MAG TPA: DNA mismatch repair protein MutL, partial [Dehalococcoidia bacterium]|nr:DNA mismatch repair protein MutL [Dehalococcoidia bacterium]